jgi:hypothetical protein
MNPFIKAAQFFLIMLSIFNLIPFVYADATSTNYKLESNLPTGGGSFSITSANYKLEEGSIDWIAKSDQVSTNYKVDGKTGINGTELIPVIASTNPGDLARFFTDQSASFTVSATTPSGNSLTYQAAQDGVVKAGWQASNVLNWALGVADKGRRSLALAVTETNGTVLKQQSMYVFRRPIK